MLLVSQNYVYAWLLRSFTRAQTTFIRACALVGPGVATPLFSSEGSIETGYQWA